MKVFKLGLMTLLVAGTFNPAWAGRGEDRVIREVLSHIEAAVLEGEKALRAGGGNEQLEAEGVEWAQKVLEHSPLSIRCLKSAFNADVDGQQGLQELAGNATLLYYMTEEGEEGRKAWNEKREPDFKKYPWLP